MHGGHQGAKKSTTDVLSVIRGKCAGVSSIRGDRIASLIKIAMSAASCLPVGERDFYFCVISCDQEVALFIIMLHFTIAEGDVNKVLSACKNVTQTWKLFTFSC